MTGTREPWLLSTTRDLSASKAVMLTAIGDIIAAWKGRANTFRIEKASLLWAVPGFPDARYDVGIHPQPTDYTLKGNSVDTLPISRPQIL